MSSFWYLGAAGMLTFLRDSSAYASEVCPLALRGFLTAFVNICWVLGQLIAAGVLEGLVDNTTKWAYKIPFAVQWLWPIPLFVLAYMAPDSPWWLVRKGRVAEAEQSVLRLSSNSTLEEARLKVAMMVHTNSYEVALNTESSYWDCFKGTNLRRTEIACMILAAQTLSGEVRLPACQEMPANNHRHWHTAPLTSSSKPVCPMLMLTN